LGLFLGFWENDPVLLVGVAKPRDFFDIVIYTEQVSFVAGTAWMVVHRKPLILKFFQPRYICAASQSRQRNYSKSTRPAYAGCVSKFAN